MAQKRPPDNSWSFLLAIDRIRYGEQMSFSGLTLIPLFAKRPAPVEYVILSEAIRTGAAVVEEVGQGHVPTLRVVNRGEKPVLLVEGEHLLGGKQNRVLNTTILVPGTSAVGIPVACDIPVSCVEAGRWRSVRATVDPRSPHLFLRTRAQAAEAVTWSARVSGEFHADQATVWHYVADTLSALEAASPTSAMHEAYKQKAEDLARYVKHLPWQPGQTGVIAAVGGKILCADLFDRPETLEGLWNRLIPSYAVEAISAADEGTVLQHDAEGFLQGALDATVTAHPAVGRGTNLRLTGDGLVGAALEVDGAIIHLAIFRRAQRSVIDGRARNRP